MLPAMHRLAARFGARAGAAIVYIAEAHATDEWPISSARANGGRGPVCVAQVGAQCLCWGFSLGFRVQL